MIKHFTKLFGGKNDIVIEDDAMNFLINYNYPGNTREIKAQLKD
ncbi:MAG: hypothetical protein R2771_06260 [Saprospiraceae bacterium]